MDKRNAKVPIMLKIAVGFFAFVFIGAVASLIYFRVYLSQDVVASSNGFISSIVGEFGLLYYGLIPFLALASVVIWYLIVKSFCKHRKLSELASPKPVQEQPMMRDVPFQDSVIQHTKPSSNDKIIDEMPIQTGQSPLVSMANADTIPTVVSNQTPREKIGVPQQFAPKYMLEDYVSTISELKKVIAKSKLPEIILLPNQTAQLSDVDQARVVKLKSFNHNKTFNSIKLHQVGLDKLVSSVQHNTKCEYKIMEEPEKNPEPSKQALRYLTADEIVAIHRKQKSEQVKLSMDQPLDNVDSGDEQGLNDIAKFYYQNNPAEYMAK